MLTVQNAYTDFKSYPIRKISILFSNSNVKSSNPDYREFYLYCSGLISGQKFFRLYIKKCSFYRYHRFNSCTKTVVIYINLFEIETTKIPQRRKKTEQFRGYLNCSVCLAPQVGLEPTTLRLTAACSAN